MISGMHGLSVLPDSIWTLKDQGELTDYLTTHPYPIFSPHCRLDPLTSMRTFLHPAAQTCLYRDIGEKPCFVEEMGTLGPMFLSWVILGGIILDFASPVSGALNKFIEMLGGESIYFFGKAALFPYMVVITDLWRDLGFSTIIFLAALSSVDPNLYEAAIVDGAGRWKQTWHISLPAMMPIVMLSTILSLGVILKAGFAQILNLYSPMVYSTGDIIDTYVYRIGLREGRYSMATAVGLFQSSVSFVLITISYWFANKFSNYRVF